MRTMAMCLVIAAAVSVNAQSDSRGAAVAHAQTQQDPEGDHDARDAMEWGRVLGLRDEFVVQELMREGLDPARGNQVRALLLEVAIHRERTVAAFVAATKGLAVPEWRSAENMSNEGVEARKTVDRRLATILSDSEARMFWDHMVDAHTEAVLYLRLVPARHERQIPLIRPPAR